MKYPNFYFTCVLLLVCFPGLGQSDFRPGYYITHDFDTIYGQIDHRSDRRQTTSCSFRSGDKSEASKFTPSDILAYRFIDGKYFISKWVEVEDESKLIFVEYLVNGIANLYFYRDISGDHYSIETKNGYLVNLVNEKQEVEHNGISYMAKGYQQVGQLKASFSDCYEIQKEIDYVVLDHKSLINITEKYHNYVCDGEQCIVYQREVPAVRVSFSPTFGISVNKLAISNSAYYEKIDFLVDVAPTFGLLVNLETPRLNEKLAFQVGADFLKNSYAGSFEDVRYASESYIYSSTVNTSTLRLMFAVKYRYPKGKVRPTLVVGPQFNYLLNSQVIFSLETPFNTIEREETPLTDITIGAFVAVGVDFRISKKRMAFCNLKFLRTSGWQKEVTTFLSASLNAGVYF
jgi:hypothetical protein